MQIERAADGTHKCWLREGEFQAIVDAADGWRDELVVRLGGEVGLRSCEIPQITPGHIRREVGDDFDAYFLRVPEGKDTADGVGKPRDAYLPRRLETEMTRFAEERDLEDDDPYAPVTPRRIQQVVKGAADRAAEATGDDDFLKVSSHDLRRYFAQTLLVRERLNPRVVMDVGGWSEFKAIEPYLNKPDPGTIAREFARAGLE
jgi:integrase